MTLHPRPHSPRTMALVVACVVATVGIFLAVDNIGAQPPESCGPQELVVADTTASVDPEGCPVDLVVWSGDGTPDTVFVLPQTRTGLVTGGGLLEVDLPCGWFQVDVFDAGQFDLPAVLDQEWIDANGAVYFDLLAADHGFRVCEPEPVDTPEVPEVADAVTVDAPPAVAVLSDATFTG